MEGGEKTSRRIGPLLHGSLGCAMLSLALTTTVSLFYLPGVRNFGRFCRKNVGHYTNVCKIAYKYMSDGFLGGGF